MRLAVVVQPPQPLAIDLAPPSTRAGELRSRLILGGYRVIDLLTTPELPDQFARVMEDVGETDSVLLYLACATRLLDDAGVALRLALTESARHEVELAWVAEMLKARRPKDAFLFVDAMHDGEEGDAMTAAEHADAVVRALGGHDAGLGALIGVHARMRDERGTWPLTRLLLDALDDPKARDEQGAARVSRLYASVKDRSEVSLEVPSFALVKGASDFVVLEPAPVNGALASSPPGSRPTSSVPTAPRSRSSIPPAPRSLPAGAFPAIEPILDAAAEARGKMDFNRALDEYKKALMLTGASDLTARASLYANIAEVKRAQGKPREAELNFEKALECMPSHRRSVEALITLAIDAGEWERAVQHRRRLLGLADSDEKKCVEYHRIADVYEYKAKDPKKAAEVLKEACGALPPHRETLDRLKVLCEVTHDWQGVVDVLGARCRAETDAHERAALRFAQADILLGRMRDERKGIGLLEAALEEDPTLDRAMLALVAVRSRREEWGELERLYTRLIDRHAERHDAERAWEACKQLGMLRRDKLLDGPGAIDSFRGALRCKPQDWESRAMLAELLIAKGERDAAVAELALVAEASPLRAATYRRIFELHSRAGRNDRAWLAGCVLAELDAADVNAELFVEQHRVAATKRPSKTLDDAGWERMRAPGGNPHVAKLMRAITPAAVAARVEELTARKALVALDPAKLQPPTSTASVVRAFVWASQVLGVEAPDLYSMDEVPGGLAAVQAARPSTAMGPDVLSGLGVAQLAFITARHLTYYRPEHYPLVFYPTLAELSALLFAVVKISRPNATIPPAASEHAAKLSERIAALISDEDREAAETALRELDESGGRIDLGAWIRCVELTATRAGMLLAGELRVAAERLRGESRSIADLTVDDKLGDLAAFSVSDAAHELRAKLGIALD
jgi:tetratricopeptide (TPR) repeat protein